MSFYGRSSQDSPNLNPLQQVRAVWLALLAVLLTLSLLFVAYGWRSYDFTLKRAQTQSQSRAELTRSQVFNAFRHMDDILLHTKSVFERSGPGIAIEPALLTRSPGLLGLAPYACLGIVNAQGDAFLRIPEGCVLPDIAARAQDFQPTGGTSRLLTDAFDGPEGAQIVRAAHLYYADQTFAGLVVGVLSTDYVFSVFENLEQASYHLDFELVGTARPGVIAHFGASAHGESMGTARTELEFEGLSGSLKLSVHSSASRAAALAEWTESVFWPFLGYLLVCGGLLQGARVLTHALRQQMVSDLLAQRARVEAEVQSRFIANISHEVRTPLNGVLGATRLLGKTTLSESQQQLLGLVERSGKVLLGTINDLLDIGKLREGQMHLEQQEVNLVELLEDSCALQAPQAFAKGLELVVLLDVPEHLGALGDALRIQQVVTNLLNNAVKFTTEGRVCLSASLFRSQTCTHLKVEVSDTGIGIDLAKADWLFQPFQQADASTARRFGGTGLGLAITDQLVRLMGGVLEAQSEPGVGTTFIARWPLVLARGHASGLDSGLSTFELAALEPDYPQTGFDCELDLPESHVGELECQALQRQLAHLGIAATSRRARRGRLGQQAEGGPAPRMILVDEQCLVLDRPEWLEHKVTLLILCREPGLFRLPPHLKGLNWKLIAKPARRSALAHALLREKHADADAEPSAAPIPEITLAPETAPASAVLQGLHVLVAEDHPVNQILIRHMLQAAGCRVRMASDGLQAFETLFGSASDPVDPFDVVLMDCQMPGLDGFRATERIRRREAPTPQTKRLPIIAMTALAMPEDMQRCLDSGMDDYCSKPIDERLLIAKIGRWTQNRDG